MRFCYGAIRLIDSDDSILLINGVNKNLTYSIDQSFTKYVIPKSPDAGYITTETDGYKLHKIDGSYWLFDSDGLITDMYDSNGNHVSFEWTDSKLTVIRTDNGGSFGLFYNESGLLRGFMTPDSKIVLYSYDDVCQLKTVSYTNRDDYPDVNETWEYVYQEYSESGLVIGSNNKLLNDFKLISVKGPDGISWLTSEYTEGKVTTQHWGDGTVSYDYHEEDNYTDVTDRRGYLTRYYYNSIGQQTRVEMYDPNNPTSPFVNVNQYDSKHNLTYNICQNGSSAHYEYDDMNNCTKMVFDPNDGINGPTEVSMTYESTFNKIKSITDAKNNSYYFTYDYEDASYESDSGNLMKVVLPEVSYNGSNVNPEYRFTYNEYGQIETIINPDSIVTFYSHDSLGRVNSITFDYGSSSQCKNIEISYSYDKYGNIDVVTTPTGEEIDYDFDKLSRLAQIQDQLGHITQYQYSAWGKVKKIQAQLGDEFNEDTAYTVEYGYGVSNMLTSVTNSLGYTSFFRYDKSGNTSAIIDPEGRDAVNQYQTKYHYDARSLKTAIVYPESSRTNYVYDYMGNLRCIEDSAGNITRYDYDGFNRISKIYYPDEISDPNFADPNFAYFDDTAIDWSDNLCETFEYDNNSNITLNVKRDNSYIKYSYDNLNRIEYMELYNADNVLKKKYIYDYDLAGRILNITEQSSGQTLTNNYNYDRLGNVTDFDSQYGYYTGYTYDNYGRQEKLIYPDGSFVTYHYDAANRITDIKDDSSTPVTIVHYDYDELSRYVTVTYANGTSISYDYSDLDDSIDDNKGDTIASIVNTFVSGGEIEYSYTYDKVGNCLTKSLNDTTTVAYTYDNNYQLTYVYDNNGIVWGDYVYDNILNRINAYEQDSVNISFDNYVDSLNHYCLFTDYIKPATIVPEYDDNGNMTFDGSYHYVYNSENQLVELWDEYNTYQLATYVYDFSGRRVSKTANGVVTDYVYDGSQVIAEYVDGCLAKKYIAGPWLDQPIAMITVAGENEIWYYYHRDRQGNIIALSSETGSLVEKYEYTPYGMPLVCDDVNTFIGTESCCGNPYMFTGRRYDSESGLYYYRARMYSPQLGRFMQVDPLRYYDSMNLYQYCGNNPVNLLDPMGLEYCVNPRPLPSPRPKPKKPMANASRDRMLPPLDSSEPGPPSGGYLQALNDYNKQRHYNRNSYQEGKLPKGCDEAKNNGWKKMSTMQSSYHRNGKDAKNNTKWVSPDGRMEAVYNGHGYLDNSPANRGTYNFTSPYEDPWGHFRDDVYPYYRYGNSPDDPTPLRKRIFGAYCPF